MRADQTRSPAGTPSHRPGAPQLPVHELGQSAHRRRARLPDATACGRGASRPRPSGVSLAGRERTRQAEVSVAAE